MQSQGFSSRQCSGFPTESRDSSSPAQQGSREDRSQIQTNPYESHVGTTHHDHGSRSHDHGVACAGAVRDVTSTPRGTSASRAATSANLEDEPSGVLLKIFSDSGVRRSEDWLDLRGLNSILVDFRFKMLTTSTLLSRVRRGAWFASMGLKDVSFTSPSTHLFVLCFG